MWFIDTTLLTLVGFYGTLQQDYAILSHTWGEDEVTFASFQEYGAATEKTHPSVHDTAARQKILASSGYAKIKNAAKLARSLGLRFLWVDTCCIDKTSSAELSESINSMYRWYRDAKFCIAYLSDVEPTAMSELSARDSNFRHSRWFTRGWTLQELVAPKTVMFYAKDWSYLMAKEPMLSSQKSCALLAEITGIDQHVLLSTTSHTEISVANRMRWASCRKTTRPEDMAYCLLGLFNVNMPLLYGEGERAFVRLQEEILKETDDQSLFLWALSPEERRNPDQLYGLLARSTRSFSNVDFDYVRPLPPSQSQESAPASITNQGLRTSLMLVSSESKDDAYYAMLDCVVVRPQDTIKDWSPYIILRRLWGDQFARIASPDEASKPLPYEKLASKDGSVGLLPVAGPEFFDEDAQGSYRTIYVRQSPFDTLPEVTVRSNYLRSPDSLRLTYSVVDAYPPERWDAASSVVRIKDPRSGGTIVALRLTSEGSTGQSFVDMTVGLRRVGGRWEVCYEKHPYAGISSRIENVYRGFPYISAASDAKSHDGIQLLEAVAITDTEIQRRGRRFIQLDIFGVSQRPTNNSGRNMPQYTEEAAVSLKVAKERFQRLSDRISVTSRQCCYVDSFGPSIYAALPSRNGVRTRYPGDLSDFMDKQFDNITIPEDKPYFELMKAIKDGNFPGVHISTAKDKGLIESTIEELDDCKPIHCAASVGFLGAVRWLVHLGADVQAYTKSGLMPIHLAVLRRRFDIACELAAAKLSHKTPMIEEHPWKRFLTRQQETVLHLLAAYGQPGWADTKDANRLFEILELHTAHLHRNDCGELAMHRAAATGNSPWSFDAMESTRTESLNPGAVYERSEQGDLLFASVYARDEFGRSVLFHAACGGNVSVIHELVRLGASTDLTDDHGRTPLHAAVLAGQASAVKALRGVGATVDRITRIDGLTPLHLACLYGFEDCVEELLRIDELKESASTTKFSAGGAHGCFHALHVAVGNGHTGCVAKLLQYSGTQDIPGEGYIKLRDSTAGTLKEGQLVVFETPLESLAIAVLMGKTEISSQIDAKMGSSSVTSPQKRIEALLSKNH
ncbi:het domain protein [Colletotrichum kahawae]|uniref:Het domain protein n=1 Tax=Colletotrichum kahawae TaxID=34407 RepID=A0AAE0D6A6_COLKA|nr:het domain protein [Colletotrichum kahawae]